MPLAHASDAIGGGGDSSGATREQSAVDARWISAFAFAALLLGTFRLHDKGLWVDEAVSLRFALQSPGTWFDDNNSALFYALLSAVVHLFGDSEAALRAPSVLAFAGSTPPFYALLARGFDARTARIGCALFVSNAFLLRFAQEARGYMLAVCLVTSASWALLRLAARPHLSYAVCYGLCMGLALHAHAFAVWVLLAHGMVVAHHFWSVRRIAAQVLVALAVAGSFALPLVLWTLRAGTGQISWIKRPTVESCATMLVWFAGGSALLALAYGISFVAFVATHVASKRELHAQQSFASRVLGAWFLVPVCTTVLLSLLIKPIVHPKYLLVALPGLVGAVAVSLSRLRSGNVRRLAVVGVLGLSSTGLYDWYAHYEKEQWREAVALLREKWQPEDALVLDVSAPEPFDYYVLAAPRFERLPPPVHPDRAWSVLQTSVREHSTEQRRARFDAAPRLWLVTSRSHDFALRGELSRHHRPAERIRLEPRDGDSRSVFADSEGRIIMLESFVRTPTLSAED